MAPDANRLYFGDCLEVMREDIPDESVDLIYLDPPFNSKRLYNAFIGDAQWVAFNDTWRWHEAVDDFHDVAKDVKLASTIEGLRLVHGEGPDLAYLSYMANRLRECLRVLKPTGCLYLHCDPKMSHSLKLVMDGIFGTRNFKNEIVWYYRGAGIPKMDFARRHDIIFRYSKKPSGYYFDPNPARQPYATATVERFSHYIGNVRGGRDYGEQELNPKGKHPDDVFTDIQPVAPSSLKRYYPTQKPLELLERILQTSSKVDDVVFDPFCGCGTTIEAAEKLERQWIGIDICVNACKVIENRLLGSFPGILWTNVEFIGMPRTLDHAKTLASLNKFRFERWAASLVDGMEANKKQHWDKGIDGRGRFPIRKGKFIDLVSQVKGGGTGPGDVQAFNGARQQAGADLGIFTCFADRVTLQMRNAAASAGRFMEVPIVQIYTVEDYFAERKPKMPMMV